MLTLGAILAVILVRSLRADLSRYNEERQSLVEGGLEDVDESGWKVVHADVFRPPQYPGLLCACVASGAQLGVMALLVLGFAYVGFVITYYTLCAENHRWWWRAFLAPATTGLYVFGYAAYYYGAHLQDEAFDVLQAGLFFGYMALVALGVALVAGAAGFLASLKFLAYIFAQIKFD